MLTKDQKKRGTVIMLSSHDLEEVRVIMSTHVVRESVVAQRREQARNFYFELGADY